MAQFTSRQLYLMNGGEKLYIYKDGFGDIYNATTAEEAEWAKEVTDAALQKIATEENAILLTQAIGTLQYYKYDGLPALLLQYIEGASPARQIIFATALWNMVEYGQAFEIIFGILLNHRAACLNEVFAGLNKFETHAAGRHFLIHCLQGNDDELFKKAQTTLAIWAYTGLPELRQNNLLAVLQFENKNEAAFKPALDRLKMIFKIKK